jgi:restriction endonuclease S subunit
MMNAPRVPIHKELFQGNTGTTFDAISTADLKEKKIPLSPPDVQKQIAIESETVDKEVTAVQAEIETANCNIEDKVIAEFEKNYSLKKLSEFNVAVINPSKTEIRQADDNTLVSFVEMASVSETGLKTNSIEKPLKDLRKGSYTYFAENDIIIAKITPCMENGKCALAKGLSNGLGMGSSEFNVIRANQSNVLPEYLFALLNRQVVRAEAEKVMAGTSGHRRVPASFYESYLIPSHHSPTNNA